MRKIIILTILSLIAFSSLNAQEISGVKDTNKIIAPPVMDSTYYLRNIFSMLDEQGPVSNKVSIEQTKVLESAFISHIAHSAGKKINGYRIRIYSGNNQFARNESGTIASQFSSQYPGISVYRTYTNPYFKVTIGDFRTKSDAKRLLNIIEGPFQAAFVVREIINFPPL